MLRSTTGWLFKADIHDWMAIGGSFKSGPLPIKDQPENTVLKFQTIPFQVTQLFQ